MDNYVITIARGFGSGGKQIGSQLAKDLGIHCYENRILTLASEFSGVDETRFMGVDERLKGSTLMDKLRDLPRAFSPKPERKKFNSDDKLFEYQKEIILKLAKEESCVIIGKCADYILKDFDNVFSVYIEAPRAFCLKRIMNRMDISAEEATLAIESTDKYRSEYYKYYTGGNYWTNPVNYDITLNSDRMGIENCVEMIKRGVEIKLGMKLEE